MAGRPQGRSLPTPGAVANVVHTFHRENTGPLITNDGTSVVHEAREISGGKGNAASCGSRSMSCMKYYNLFSQLE